MVEQALTLIRVAVGVYVFWNFDQVLFNNVLSNKNFKINVFLKKHFGSKFVKVL